MLGLGGVAAATGLATGAKVLGGTVNKAGTLSTANFADGAKVISSSDLHAMFTPELWAQEALEQLHVVTPDFSSTPGPCNDSINVGPPRRKIRGSRPAPVCTITTDTGKLATFQLQGSFTYTALAEVEQMRERGELTIMSPGNTKVVCELSGQIEWAQEEVVALLREASSFTLDVDDGEEQIRLLDCRWLDMSHDLMSGDFELNFVSGDRVCQWVGGNSSKA